MSARVNVPAIDPGHGRDIIPETAVDVHPDGRVTLPRDGRCIGTVIKGNDNVPINQSPSGAVGHYATPTAWKAQLPGESRPSFNGNSYSTAYRRNTRRGAIAYLLTAVHGEANSYFNWVNP